MNRDKFNKKISNDVFVHVAICLNLCVLDSHGRHFGNMRIKKCHHLYSMLSRRNVI